VFRKVFVNLNARPFAFAVQSSGLVKRVDERFDVAAVVPQPLHRLGILSSSGCVLFQ
jgi:hypothetical protein